MAPESPRELRALRQLQRAFVELVTAADAAAVAPVAAVAPLDALGAEPMLVGEVYRPALERVRAYAEAYFWRLHDVLLEQHPALRRALGGDEDAFTALVRRYLLALPPRGHDAADAGERLPLYLATDARTAARPWLAELARLERLHVELLGDAAVPPLTLAAVRTCAPARLASARLATVPAFVALACEHDLAALWLDPEATPRRVPTRLVVWRRQLEVLHRRVGAAEWRVLERVAQGMATLETLK